jgi:streptomycin 6-kinase
VTVLDVPEIVRNMAAASGAGAWLDALPALVASLEAEWGISVGAAFGDSTEAFVASAVLRDGTPAVLKLLIPRSADVARHEITVLRLAGGSGCARLLRSDASRGALLLERLARSLHSLGLPLSRRHEILCDAVARIWRAAPDCGLPTGAERGRALISYITRMWETLGRPCSERAVDVAVACAERRVAAHDDERAVLVHGDVHEWNALEALEAPAALDGGAAFKLVDPDGRLAEAEYDMGVLMREDPLELLVGDPRERARWLARRCGLDATAIWEWGMAQRVSTGLLATQVDLQPLGRQMLAAADRLAGL